MPQKRKAAKKEPPYAARNFDVVALGASAGGLNALIQVLKVLPKGFPSTIVLVQHLAPTHKSWIAELIGRSTPIDREAGGARGDSAARRSPCTTEGGTTPVVAVASS
jgi:chemotaxis response regulator CheB